MSRLATNILAALVVSGGVCLGASAQGSGLTTLASQRNQTRPLLIFAERADDPEMEIQLRILKEHAEEASDRQLVAIALPYRAPGPSALQLSADDAEAARRRFHVAAGDFLVVLLGKDGGAKLRSAKPIPMSKLEATIDAMPMRQEEMRSGK